MGDLCFETKNSSYIINEVDKDILKQSLESLKHLDTIQIINNEDVITYFTSKEDNLEIYTNDDSDFKITCLRKKIFKALSNPKQIDNVDDYKWPTIPLVNEISN